METNNSLLKSIQTIAEQKVDTAPYDKTRNAIIIANLGNGFYTIELDGIKYNNIEAYAGVSDITKDTIVKIVMPCNQPSQMFIVPPANNSMNQMLDFFYPIGTIYETTNGNFNPNITWGGTWQLLEGQFLLGSSNEYIIGATGGADSQSITPAGTIGSTTLTAAQSGLPAHKHTVNNGTNKIASDSAVSGLNRTLGSAGTSGGDYYYIRANKTGYGLDRNTITLDNNTAKSATEGHDHSFTGTASTIDTMPPYTVVNMWKRIA